MLGDDMNLIEDANMLITFDNITIKILKITHEPDKSPCPRHCHGKNFYELHFIVSDGGLLITDEGEFFLSENMFYMAGPYVYHTLTATRDRLEEEFCIQMEVVSDKRNATSSVSDLFCNTHFWIGKDGYNSRMLFDAIKNECENKILGHIERTKSLVSMILVNLVRNYSGAIPQPVYEKKTPDDKRMAIVDSSFLLDFAILSLKELSSRLKLSPRQTQRFLIKNYHRTFSELKREARLSKAAEQLNLGKSMSDVAQMIGYNDIRSLKNKLR